MRQWLGAFRVGGHSLHFFALIEVLSVLSVKITTISEQIVLSGSVNMITMSDPTLLLFALYLLQQILEKRG